jgi:hypothetical protein
MDVAVTQHGQRVRHYRHWQLLFGEVIFDVLIGWGVFPMALGQYWLSALG